MKKFKLEDKFNIKGRGTVYMAVLGKKELPAVGETVMFDDKEIVVAEVDKIKCMCDCGGMVAILEKK